MQLKELFLASVAACLVSCSAGSQSQSQPTYGNLQNSSIESEGVSWSVDVLQNYLIGGLTSDENTQYGFTSLTGVCNGVGPAESFALSDALCETNTLASVDGNSGTFGTSSVETMVSGNSLGITTVTPYKISYDTPGQPYVVAGGTATKEQVSGVVLVPNIAYTTPAQLKGVVLFYHPTVLSKFEIPSNFDTNPGSLQIDMDLASVFASQGYIVVAPDYVGQGIDSHVVHPYAEFPQTNALSGIYMLGALRQFLTKESIALPTADLYVSSYSEGGAYALWTSKLIQTQGQYASFLRQNGFTLKKTVAISGAYDLSGAMEDFAFTQIYNSEESTINVYNASPGCVHGGAGYCDAINALVAQATGVESNAVFALQNFLAQENMAASKAGLGSYLLASFIAYNSTNAAYSIVMNPSFVNMGMCTDGNLEPIACSIAFSPYDFAGLFSTANNTNLTTTIIDEQLFTSAVANSSQTNGYFSNHESLAALTAPLNQGTYVSVNNDVSSFITPLLVTDPTVEPVVAKANIYNWTTASPVSLVYLDYDSTVTNINSKEACNLVSGVHGMSGNFTCVNVDNTQFFTSQLATVNGVSTYVPLMMDHGQAEALLQLVALNQFQQ